MEGVPEPREEDERQLITGGSLRHDVKDCQQGHQGVRIQAEDLYH